MKVKVKPYLFLQQALGSKEIAIDLPEKTNMQELLQVLHQDYGLPEKLKVAGGNLHLMDSNMPVGLIILVNGHNIRQQLGIKTVLNERDIISLFPPAAGG